MNDIRLKGLQRIELEILLKVKDICEKYDIKYFLVAGTLLGAVRHKGFIPWDDDVDICMPWNDYCRFCNIAQSELGEEYFLQNYETDFTNRWFTKVRKNGTALVEAGTEKLNINHGIWIDVFPLIGVKDDKKWLNKTNRKLRRIKRIMTIAINAHNVEDEKRPVKRLFMKVTSLLPLRIFRQITKRRYSLYLNDFTEYEKCFYLYGGASLRPSFDSSMFKESCIVSFEGYDFCAPKDWDKVLRREYGDDYMTPKQYGGEHHIAFIDLDNAYSRQPDTDTNVK